MIVLLAIVPSSTSSIPEGTSDEGSISRHPRARERAGESISERSCGRASGIRNRARNSKSHPPNVHRRNLVRTVHTGARPAIWFTFRRNCRQNAWRFVLYGHPTAMAPDCQQVFTMNRSERLVCTGQHASRPAAGTTTIPPCVMHEGSPLRWMSNVGWEGDRVHPYPLRSKPTRRGRSPSRRG